MQPNFPSGTGGNPYPPQTPYQQPYAAAHLVKRGLNIWLIVSGMLAVLLIFTLGFALWAFAGMQDYKQNSDEKIVAAVAVATKVAETTKDAEFTEKEKEPLRDYKGPAEYGSLDVKFPKTWSAYINEGKGNQPIDGFFHPGFVPSVQSKTNVALRVQVVNQPYAEVTEAFSSQIAEGVLKASAFRAPKVKDTLGLKLQGTFDSQTSGLMIVLPLRDKTLKIWTESTDFAKDFNDKILPNLTFVP